MALPVREIAGTAAKTVGSFREAIQDLLVPELRAVKSSIDALRTEVQLRGEQQAKATQALDERQTLVTQALGERLTQSIQALDERQTLATQALGERQTLATQALGERLTAAVESITEEMRLRDAHQTQLMQKLSEKLDFAIDIRERLAHVEARLQKQ